MKFVNDDDGDGEFKNTLHSSLVARGIIKYTVHPPSQILRKYHTLLYSPGKTISFNYLTSTVLRY